MKGPGQMALPAPAVIGPALTYTTHAHKAVLALEKWGKFLGPLSHIEREFRLKWHCFHVAECKLPVVGQYHNALDGL